MRVKPVLVFATLALATTACGGNHSTFRRLAETRSTGGVPPTAPTTLTTNASGSFPSAPPATATTVSCLAGQLDGQFRGFQGATGSWFSTFWIADTSPSSCALQSVVSVELLDARGVVERTASAPLTHPVELSADAAFPPQNANPPPTERLVSVTVGWPTLAELAGGRCPQPMFTLTTVRIELRGSQAVTITDLSADGGIPSLCGSVFRIEHVEP
jgi:hypothetical protein